MRRPPFSAMKPPKMREVMAESLMRMLMEGPLVSLRGSPTVSPTTAALNSSVGLPSPSFFLKTNGCLFSSSFYGLLLL